jgi:phenylacetate-CoA ligase
MRSPVVLDKALLIGRILRLVRRDRWSKERLRHHQEQAFASLRDFALSRSPFYRRFHKGLERAPLSALPSLSKSEYLASFDALATDRSIKLADVAAFAGHMGVADRFRERYQVVATSGTTGERAFFVFDPAEWRTAIAGGARGVAWANGGPPPRRERNAMMTTTIPWHMTARITHELRRLGISGGHMSFDSGEPVEAIVAKLNGYLPTAVIAYPSMMQILAQEQLAGRLKIAPRRIQCSAEVMTAEARDAITAAFHTAPSNLYAASECGCLAVTCAGGRGLHMLEDLHIVEVVDERGRAVPPGEAGAKVLLTVLGSRTLPLIRYELGDSLVLALESCACGLHFACLESVVGRTGDVLHFPKQDGGTVTVAPAQISACLRGLNVSGWQLSQSPSEILIECVAPVDGFAAPEIVARIEAHLTARQALAPKVAAARIDRLARGRTGKSTFVTTISR